jgi:hypothetical protein
MDLVFLHGRAATGKLTTARALERRLGWPVFHNHLVVDLLTELFPFGSDPFVRLREQMWLSVIAEAAAVDRSLVFTFTPEPTVPAGFRPDRTRRGVSRRSRGLDTASGQRSRTGASDRRNGPAAVSQARQHLDFAPSPESNGRRTATGGSRHRHRTEDPATSADRIVGHLGLTPARHEKATQIRQVDLRSAKLPGGLDS